MRTSLLRGLILALFAAITIGLGRIFGFELDQVALLGAAIGGVLAFVPGGTWERPAGFALGFVLAWIGYAMRAALLPDSAAGRAASAFIVLAVLAVVVAAAQERIPLWSGLLGVAAMVGAYEESYTAAPSQFVSQSTSSATTALLAVALGHLGASLLSDRVDAGAMADQPRHESGADLEADTTDRSSFDDLLAGDTK